MIEFMTEMTKKFRITITGKYVILINKLIMS